MGSLSWEYQPSWVMMCSGSMWGWSRIAARVTRRVGRLVEAGRLPPARVHVFEELQVLGRVHPRDRRRAECSGLPGGAEARVGDGAEDAIDPFGDLGRIDEHAAVEEGCAGVVGTVRVGGR